MKKGYIFTTKRDYDPLSGKHIKDPFIGGISTMGACRPDLRGYVNKGDCLALMSGKVKGHKQFIVGVFEVEEKISSAEAYESFPHLRLRKREDGQLDGNIIVTQNGDQHPLDDHTKFEKRRDNYIVGKTLVHLESAEEIAQGREKCMSILEELFGKNGSIPRDVIGRSRKLDAHQIDKLIELLSSLKTADKAKVKAAVAGRFGRGTHTGPRPLHP